MENRSIDFAAIVNSLRLAVLVFERSKLLYRNEAAVRLCARLRKDYQADLLVMLRDHLTCMEDVNPAASSSSAVTLLTDPRGEPLYVHALPIESDESGPRFAICVRELGVEREAFARRYGLSPREAEVAELVLRGYPNPLIASTLGIASTTTKRHLTRIFDKIGVDSRTQLVSRLA
jgi:DNA-binding CsgD family transcriptional regulator